MPRPIKNRYDLLRQNIAKFIFDGKSRQNKTFDIDNVKSILFLRDDNKIGDMVVSTCLFREIKIKYPNIKISVLCGKDNKDIIGHNPNVDEIIELKYGFVENIPLFISLGKRHFDLIADFLPLKPKPRYLAMLRLLKPEFLTGFYKKDYKIYTHSFEENLNDKHITKYYELFLNFLGIKNPSLKYDVFLGSEEEVIKRGIGSKLQGKNIVLNIFAASKHRRLSIEKTEDLILRIKQATKCNIFVLSHDEQTFQAVQPLEAYGATIFHSKSILDTAALIKLCDLVISPDTAIVHIAAAFNKKLVALYLDYSDREEKTDIIWGPNYKNAAQIRLDRKNGALSNDIENIPNELIMSKVIDFLNQSENK